MKGEPIAKSAKQTMRNRIFSLIIAFLLIFTNAFTLVPLAEKYDIPIIYPHSDTFIRANAPNANYSTNTSVVVDDSPANRRIAFIKFDLDGFEKELDSVSAITLNILSLSDAGGDGFKFALYPLSGAYKDIDLSAITYTMALDVKVDDVSLIDYATDVAQYDGKRYNWYSIDVTDYIVSQTDKTAVFMIKSLNGAFSFYSSEKADSKPYLKLENYYTDCLNDAADIASFVADKYNGMPISEDISFVSEQNGYSIAYTSSNVGAVSNSGEVLYRPGSNEEDLDVTFTATVTNDQYSDISETHDFSLSVLREGSFASEPPVFSDGTMELSFDLFSNPNGEKVFLELPADYFKSRSEYELYLGTDKVASFIPRADAYTHLVDVTDAVTSLSNISFTVSGSETLYESPKLSKLVCVPLAEAAVMEALNGLSLGDLSSVTSDLVLPSALCDTPLTWQSSKRDVISNDGRVERPISDTWVDVSGTFATDNYTYTKTFKAYVLRENTDAENNEFAPLTDPMHISDEEFFGVWNNSNNTWTKGPILMYDEISGLASVEEKAKLGDYENAKNLLLAYYRTKGGDNIYTYAEDNNYSVETDALYEKMGGWLQMDTFLASKEVGSDWEWITFDLTDSGILQSAYWLMDADMDGSYLEIESKENPNGNTAYLEIVSNGMKRVYPAIGDTYISAGDNINSNYGSEEILLCREYTADSLTPFGTNTARPYFRFNINSSYTNVTSVKLSVYARSVGSESKKIYAMKTYDLKKLEEDELTWALHYPQVFNFKETGNIWGAPQAFHQSLWNTSFEYINYWARLYQGSYLLQRYMATGGEEYAYRAFEYAMSLYAQQPAANYPRALDGGWRIESLIRTYYTGINSVHMTPEVSTAFLKYIYTHGLEFQDTTLGLAANQDSAVQVNLARICAFFPEVSQDGWWENIRQKLYNLYSNTLLNDDGSYTESTNSYITGVLTEFEAALEIVKSKEGADSEYYKFFADTYKRLVTYYMNLSYANGNQIPYGDGGRGNARNTIGKYLDYIYDGEWEYFSTYGDKGTPISYTTRMYPDKALIMMRSGWYNDDLSAFMSNDNGGSHGHCDDLALDVTAFNKYLLVDAGGAAYSEGSEFSQRRFDTIYHNTIEIDGTNQAIYATSFPGTMSLKTNDSFDLVHAGNTSIYPGFDVNRKVMMLKNRYLIVSDYIFAPDGEHTYRQAWHPDVSSNLTLIPQSGTAFTNYNSGANIKIVTADPTESEAMLFNRLTPDNSNSVSLQYAKENVTGDVVYDTVLYPTKYGENMDVSISRLPLEGVARTDATAMEITLNTDKAYYYLSNEASHVTRSFGAFSYNGEMAYAEYTEDGELKYIALTDGSELKKMGELVFKSNETINDMAITFESANIYIDSSEAIPQSSITFKAPASFDKLFFNDKEIAYTLDSGYITTTGEKIADSDYEGIKPGNPAPQGKPQGTDGAGGATSPVVPVVPVTPSVNPLKDIDGHWAYEAIDALYEKKIVSGDENGYYNPESSVTRAEFAKLVTNSLNLDTSEIYTGCFSDVSSSDWYAPYIQACFDAGIINGYDDGTFKPNATITREEMAKILCTAANHKGILPEESNSTDFADRGKISAWALEYVNNATDLELVVGDTYGNFNPQNSVTRAEAATVIFRFINLG